MAGKERARKARVQTAPLPAMFSEEMELTTDEVPVKVVPPDGSGRFPRVASSETAAGSQGRADEERRAHRRVDFGGVVTVTIAGRTLHVRCLDISDGGMSIEPMPHWTRRGDPVMVRLLEPPKQLLARVAWVRRLGESTDAVKIGVRFTSPKPGLTREVS